MCFNSRKLCVIVIGLAIAPLSSATAQFSQLEKLGGKISKSVKTEGGRASQYLKDRRYTPKPAPLSTLPYDREPNRSTGSLQMGNSSSRTIYNSHARTPPVVSRPQTSQQQAMKNWHQQQQQRWAQHNAAAVGSIVQGIGSMIQQHQQNEALKKQQQLLQQQQQLIQQQRQMQRQQVRVQQSQPRQYQYHQVQRPVVQYSQQYVPQQSYPVRQSYQQQRYYPQSGTTTSHSHVPQQRIYYQYP